MSSQWVNPVDGTKLCAKCRERLPLSDFRANARVRSGLDSWCIPCHRVATRESRAKHRVKYNAARRVRPA
jgi:hypothetical protein